MPAVAKSQLRRPIEKCCGLRSHSRSHYPGARATRLSRSKPTEASRQSGHISRLVERQRECSCKPPDGQGMTKKANERSPLAESTLPLQDPRVPVDVSEYGSLPDRILGTRSRPAGELGHGRIAAAVPHLVTAEPTMRGAESRNDCHSGSGHRVRRPGCLTPKPRAAVHVFAGRGTTPVMTMSGIWL